MPDMWGHRGARVLRGGSFNNNEPNLRAANRNNNDPTNENNNIGFRCARPCNTRLRYRVFTDARGGFL
jgi:Sulfatase-modifying factor enzyme 1